jgi:hypothetical protein
MDTTQPPTPVAKLRADLDHHRRWWPSNPLGTAEQAVVALERLPAAEPGEVFDLLDQLRGTGVSA